MRLSAILGLVPGLFFMVAGCTTTPHSGNASEAVDDSVILESPRINVELTANRVLISKCPN